RCDNHRVSSPSAAGDQAALRSCWHPVAYSHALVDGPVPATLLGEQLVVWRDGSGVAHAHSDLCVHRGTALSLGWVRGDELVCPYRGWRCAPTGRCVAIPQLEHTTRVPTKARIARFRCREQLGLVWIALDDPRWELPDVPELENPGWRVVAAGPYA